MMVARSHQYEARQAVYEVRLEAGEGRSVVVWVRLLAAGEVRLVMTVEGGRQVHLLQVAGPGYPQSDHTSLLLDLTHHNTWTQHHLSLTNTTSNLLTLSVTGDTLGPLVMDHLQPSVTCFDSVSRLSLLVSHYRYRRARQLSLEEGMEGEMRATFQQILSCKHPEGGFTVHFNTR